MRPRVSPREALRHRGRAESAVPGTSLRRCSGPVSTRGRRRARCCLRRRFRGRASHGGLRYCLQVGLRARVPLWGVSFAVSESQCPDDLVCRVQRRRSGACFAWGRGFRHCCVAVSKSRGWGADVPLLVRWCVGALLVVGVAEGRPRGGCLPPLQGASGVRRCPSPGRPSSGAGSRGSATRVSRVRSVRAWGPSTGPTACALAGRRCSLWGWRKGVPGGVCLPPLCEGRLRSGAVPPPTARLLGGLSGSATYVLWARVCGCGCPTLSLSPACPVGAACARMVGGCPTGGVACHRCEGRLVSAAVPPPAARPLERAARVPRPVCPGCGRCGRGDPAPAPQRAPLRPGVARCGGGGRASTGRVPSTIVRGV